jgi:hypothetical protein
MSDLDQPYSAYTVFSASPATLLDRHKSLLFRQLAEPRGMQVVEATTSSNKTVMNPDVCRKKACRSRGVEIV